MRRIGLAALLLVLCCVLCAACAAEEPEQTLGVKGFAQDAAVNTQQLMVSYSFDTQPVEKEYRAEDGQLVAAARYELPVLTASNAAGGKLETQTVTVRRINSYFADWLSRQEEWFSELGASAEGLYSQLAGEANNPWNEDGYYYVDEMEPSFWSNGRLACVEMQSYSFTGGVHGYSTRTSAVFDLSDGRSVAVSDLSRDWSGLQQTVTRELLQQAGALVQEYGEGMLFDDYETTIADWASRTILFGDDGMTVIFGVYDIAPYAAGEQTFPISYDLIEPYLNDYGKALIGLA